MDAKKHDEIMSFIMNKLEEENLSLSDGMSVWHTMGLFIFSQLDPKNKDISKTYADIREYLQQIEKTKQS